MLNFLISSLPFRLGVMVWMARASLRRNSTTSLAVLMIEMSQCGLVHCAECLRIAELLDL